MKTRLVFLLFLMPLLIYGQKRILDIDDLTDWPSIRESQISHNGKYVAYELHEIPPNGETLIISSLNDGRRWKIRGGNNAVFLEHIILFTKGIDSLGIFSLNDFTIRFMPQVESFKESTCGDWFSYTLKGTRQMILVDGDTSRQKVFFNVSNYYWSADGAKILLQGRDTFSSK